MPADVNEPLPPTDTVLSGFEEKFTPDEDGDEGEEGESGDDKEGEGEDEEEAEEKPVIEIKTASYDHRFPATNQVSAPGAAHLLYPDCSQTACCLSY